MTTLHDALAKLGITEIDYQNGGQTFTVKVEDLPEETLVRQFEYGRRIFNDAVNGAVHQGKNREEAAKDWLERAKAGTLGTRTGGGQRLSPIQKEQRAIVEEYLRNAGYKANDAKKAAKNPQEGFKELLAGRIATAKAIPMSKVDEADIEAVFEKNWPKVENMAQARLEEMKDGLDISI